MYAFLFREAADIDDTLIKEVCQHASMCQEKSRIFHGREDVIAKIKAYLAVKSETKIAPLVVHGQSGCGKTSVIAKAAAIAKKEHPNCVQVTRFIGTTSESSTIAKLLYSVCCQLQRATGTKSDKVPQVWLFL